MTVLGGDSAPLRVILSEAKNLRRCALRKSAEFAFGKLTRASHTVIPRRRYTRRGDSRISRRFPHVILSEAKNLV